MIIILECNLIQYHSAQNENFKWFDYIQKFKKNLTKNVYYFYNETIEQSGYNQSATAAKLKYIYFRCFCQSVTHSLITIFFSY